MTDRDYIAYRRPSHAVAAAWQARAADARYRMLVLAALPAATILLAAAITLSGLLAT